MAEQNKVQVIFEAVLNRFKNDVKGAAESVLQIGDAGKEASKSLDFSP